MEVAFYHCLVTSVEEALLTIIEKILSLGERAVIMTPSETRLSFLDHYLWTQKPNSFYPHGTAKDGFSEHQPLYLTSEEIVPNGAQFIILLDGAKTKDPGHYKRVIEVFNGGNEDEVSLARQKWQSYKKLGLHLMYFRQTEDRSWLKQA